MGKLKYQIIDRMNEKAAVYFDTVNFNTQKIRSRRCYSQMTIIFPLKRGPKNTLSDQHKATFSPSMTYWLCIHHSFMLMQTGKLSMILRDYFLRLKFD